MGMEAGALKRTGSLGLLEKVYTPQVISGGKKERPELSPPAQPSSRGAARITGNVCRGGRRPGTVGLGGEPSRNTHFASVWLENKTQGGNP